VLHAFYSFTSPSRNDSKGDDDTDAGVKKRLTAVEERLTDLERRGLLPVRPTEALDWR